MPDDRTVFVVDDDRAAASSVEALLMSFGLQVETYSSAEEFLATFDGSRSGCLVLDVRLQGMNGLDLQTALSEYEMPIPIIMVSGHADQDTSDKAVQNGAVACLEKPFDGRKLYELVRATLS